MNMDEPIAVSKVADYTDRLILYKVETWWTIVVRLTHPSGARAAGLVF